MWVIQHNLLNDDAYWRFTVAFDEMGIPWKSIKVIPFADELTDFEGIENPAIFYGSTSLQRQVLNHGGFTPGVWAGPNFDYMLHIEKYGSHMLNHDAKVYAFKDIPEFEGILFMRPVHDTKAFTGTLVEGAEFRTWQEQVGNAHTQMFEDTLTLVTSPKNVAVEYRFFVVGGKVITGSQYRVNERLKKRFISFSPVDDRANPLDREAWDFCQARVNEWAPADAFVMDIGVVGDEDDYKLKIVEINSFNCSGIYDCDERAIIQAAENLTSQQ